LLLANRRHLTGAIDVEYFSYYQKMFMRHCLIIFVLIQAIPFISCAQDLLYKESKQPFFRNDEWVMDVSEITIYDDDLLFGRIKFHKDKAMLDTVASKISIPDINFVFDQNNTVSEVGKGMVDFYSTKFKKKYTRPFYYFVSSVDQTDYLTFVIDIEDRGSYVPLPFMIKRIPKDKGNFEIQVLDVMKQLSDFRLVRTY
jgi:hypothetical protein